LAEAGWNCGQHSQDEKMFGWSWRPQPYFAPSEWRKLDLTRQLWMILLQLSRGSKRSTAARCVVRIFTVI